MRCDAAHCTLKYCTFFFIIDFEFSMAHLLGSKFCLESLGNDTMDLQSAINDVFSRVGPVRYPSWKFPDKISSDIDVSELLEEFKYTEDDEEHSQVSHIVSFELVIDRMVLLLQSFTRYIEQLQQIMQGRPVTRGDGLGSQMSIGLVVRKFWNKMVQLYSAVQQCQSENKSKSRTIHKLESINKELQLKSGNGPISLSASTVFHPQSSGKELLNNSTKSPISMDTHNVSCQTLETAFVPCEACARVQVSLKEVSEMIAGVCASQGLTSALRKHMKDEIDDTLTAADIARWSNEQSKDLERINLHLENLMKQIDPLTTELGESKDECLHLKESLAKNEKDLRKEKAQKEAQLKTHLAKLKDVERKHSSVLSAVEKSNEELKSYKRTLEAQITVLRNEAQEQKDTVKKLEQLNTELTDDLDVNRVAKGKLAQVESQLADINKELATTQAELDETSRNLNKEQAKNRSIHKHSQGLQIKHDALLQRVDELNEECEELKEKVEDMEEGKEKAIETLTSTQEELKQLKEELKNEKDLVAKINSEKDFLMSSIQDLQKMIITLEDQLQETEEKMRMICQYSDQPTDQTITKPRDSEDMSKQMQANSVRIEVLEETNNMLRENISKLMQGGQHLHTHKRAPSGPAIPLWQQSGGSTRKPEDNQLYTYKSPPVDTYGRNSGDADHPISNMFPRPPSRGGARQTSAEKKRTSISSAQIEKVTSSGNASLGAYMKLKVSGNIKSAEDSTKHAEKTPGKAKIGWKTPAPSQQSKQELSSEYISSPMYVCRVCDRMYTTEQDLEIHKSYCF
ncbi:coiled-coil domain-containing protein 157-like [Anneissia japonica]|uniref:coiled-coil domain-containing protein 157-like n=1 Tax=Anneissia japonica TaxID=1529436 RepID=UPI0014255CC3|nr:coiled-coil domain-containing protein 157-like [Anneissia japonica]